MSIRHISSTRLLLAIVVAAFAVSLGGMVYSIAILPPAGRHLAHPALLGDVAGLGGLLLAGSLLVYFDRARRFQTQNNLRWKAAFLEAQVNSTIDGILVLDPQNKILLQNQRCVDLWKLPPVVIDGRDHQARMRWIASVVTDPEGFAARVEHLSTHPEETSRDEIAFRDGTFLDRYSAPVTGQDGTYYGRIWTFRDITARKHAEQSLRESEARFQLIADNVPGMVHRYVLHPDGSGQFLYVSEGCRQVFGAGPEQFLNTPTLIHDAVYPEDRADFERVSGVAVGGMTPWFWQGRIRRTDNGEVRCIQGASQPERRPNGDIVWSGVIVDITERQQAEEDRRAKDEAERTNRAKSKFLSRVSHELRTPLNAILGFGQVLEMSLPAGQDAAALGFILQAGRQLLSLVDEVLDLSRAETGELRLTPADVNVERVARECVGLLARLAQERAVTCEVEGASTWPRSLWCDEQRLRQVLLNLLSNAIKYNRAGGTVSVLCTRAPGRRVRLKISDTGSGLSAGDVRKLFTAFERLEHENGVIEGTGLGLVVSRRIAEAMGGGIGVESAPGQGSTFWIDLPATEPPPEAARAADEAATATGPDQRLPPASVRLLYIEDSASNLQVVEMLLRKCRPRWTFLAARDGHAGLEQACREHPDVILLDLQLPGLPGDEVLRELRRDPATRGIPVVVLSADATAHSRDRLLRQGADAYVSKPFEANVVLETLDRMLMLHTLGTGD